MTTENFLMMTIMMLIGMGQIHDEQGNIQMTVLHRETRVHKHTV